MNTFVSQLPTYKSATKAVLQRDLGLDQDPQRILISFVGRLAEQKGLQLLTGFAAGDGVSVMESILLRYPQVQFVVAGPQVDSLSRQFRGLVEYLCWKHRGRVAGIYNFIPHEYALEIFTASDFYLMPSRFEPGGLTQLEALSCGSLVIARNVGGLSATLCHVDDPSGKGNSFLFNDYTTTALRDTICWAIDSTRDEKYRRKLINRAARCEHDWENRVPQYVALFQHIAGVLDGEHPYDHLSKRVPILECLRP
ncbi:MAG: glycogen synthase [Deltaproteobacteria bacterium]|nr:glycogen synthase [Deltaproteobacteria bacterium]